MDKLIHVDWNDLLIPTHSIAEMVVRGTAMYIAMFLIFRFVMKRQTGSIGIADILLIVIIADAAQNAFAREYRSLSEGVVLVLTIAGWAFLIDWLAFRFPALSSLLQAPPLPLIRNGKILHRNLRQEFITREELESQLRKQGIEHVADVKAAWMEGDGDVSIIKKTDDDQPKRRTSKAVR
jgi:uncharacterized membrane protein YcaP (DUF421 family)